MARSLKTLMDITGEEFTQILDIAEKRKSEMLQGKRIDALSNKVVGLLFEKPSTRTRAGFESAVLRMGGSPVYLPASELQLKRGEPVKDTARIFGSYFDCIVARVNSHSTILELAEHAGKPVINGLCNLDHPTQAICDLFTVREVFGKLKGLTLAYIGDGNNVCHSLLVACAHAGMNINAACPDQFQPRKEFVADAKKLAEKSGAKINLTTKPNIAAESADVLYTDTWVSMGEDSEKEKKIKAFSGFTIDESLIRLAKPTVKVMHCLPAYRGYEITEDALEGKNSIAWQQGANKMYSAAGVLEFFLR